MGELAAIRGAGKGLRAELTEQGGITVRFRRGNEVVRKGSHHSALRKLFQEYGVPASCRDFMPLVYIENRLVALPGLYVDPECRAAPGADSIDLIWRPGPDYVFPIAGP
jgi:tRNA(Ile)-lysidine synthase